MSSQRHVRVNDGEGFSSRGRGASILKDGGGLRWGSLPRKNPERGASAKHDLTELHVGSILRRVGTRPSRTGSTWVPCKEYQAYGVHEIQHTATKGTGHHLDPIYTKQTIFSTFPGSNANARQNIPKTMDDEARAAYESQSLKLRADLKQWEGDWANAHAGKKPGRGDIKQNPDIGTSPSLSVCSCRWW